jgi:membrane protein DedA with SNARE-associated domain
MYAIGRQFGHRVLREHSLWARLVKPHREAQMQRMIQRHGLKVLLLARFLVGLRSPVFLSAGILRLPLRRFLLIDVFCASAVIGLFFGLSYAYGETIANWIRDAEVVLTIVVVFLAIAAAVYFWRRRRLTTPVESDFVPKHDPTEEKAQPRGATNQMEQVLQ